MLPKYFHPHDKKWIEDQLQKLNPQVRESICHKYSEVYEQEFNVSDNFISPEGDARIKANVRLRIFVERVAGASSGVVKRPYKR